MNILSFTGDRRPDHQAALSDRVGVSAPARRPFQFAYIGDGALARECFARSRSIQVIEAAPGSNRRTWNRLPVDAQSGRPITPDVLFIEAAYPGVETHALLRDVAARQPGILVVIVADWDDDFAAKCFTLGADDYIVRSTAAFQAVAFRMGRLLAHSAHLRAHPVATADTAKVTTLEREVAAATLALQRAEQQHAAEMTDASVRLVAARAAADALEAKLGDAAAELERAEDRAAIDRQAAADAVVQQQAAFDKQLAVEVAERQLRTKQLAHAAMAVQEAERRLASQMAEAAERFAAATTEAEAHAVAAASIDTLQRQLDDAAAMLTRVEQQAAADRQAAIDAAADRQAAIDAAAERRATFEAELTEEIACRVAAVEALETKLRDGAVALRQAEERAAADRQTAADVTLQRQAEFDNQLAAEVTGRQMLAKQLAGAVEARQQADQQHASERADAAAQLGAMVKQAEGQAAAAAAEVSLLKRQLDDTATTLARVEQQAAADRQAAIDAAAQRQATYEADLTQEVARRAAAVEAFETKLRDGAVALQQAEERAAADRQTASDAAVQRQAEFDNQLAAEVTGRQTLAKQLAGAVEARQQADQQHASERADAAAQLGAMMKQAEGQAAAAAAEVSLLKRQLDDTATTLARVEQQAAADRQAAIDAAAERQATYEADLTQEVARRAAAVEALETKLRDGAAALQQAAWRAAVDRQAAADAAVQRQAEFDTQLAAAQREAETEAARTTAAIDALQRELDDTAATLTRVEQQAAADRQAAIDAAAERRATFEAELTEEISRRSAAVEALETKLRNAAVALQQAAWRAAVDRQTAADAAVQRQAEFDTQLAAAKREAETEAVRTTAAIDGLQKELDDTAATLTHVEHLAAADRQAAIDVAAQRQATYEADLTQEISRRAAAVDALETKLREGAVALQQAAERAAVDRQAAADAAVQRQAEFDTQLAAAQREAEVEAARTTAAIDALQKELDDTVATLTLVEHLAAADRHAAIDEGKRRGTEFASSLRQAEERAALEQQTASAQAARRQADMEAKLGQEVARREAVEREHRRRFDLAPVSMCRCAPDGTISLANHAFARFLGYQTPEELQTVDFASAVFESVDELQSIVERCLASRSTESVETTWIRKDGSRIIVRILAVAITPDSIEMTPEDITTVRVLEEKLRSSQRMEAVARYGSEVAAMCDNLLRHIEEEARRWLARSDGGAARHHGELVLDDVTRAAKCLQQLTVYGQEEKKGSEPVNLNKVLRNLEPVLKRVAGQEIDLVLPKGATSFNLDVDAERVERMLVNVAAYGRERMPFGGRLMFQVAPVMLDGTFVAKYPNVRPGAHALLTVIEKRGTVPPDRSAAMHDQTPGTDANGPGVDLATLQALVSGCGGHLWMMAEPRGDMILKIHLPCRLVDRFESRPSGKLFARPPWTRRAASARH